MTISAMALKLLDGAHLTHEEREWFRKNGDAVRAEMTTIWYQRRRGK